MYCFSALCPEFPGIETGKKSKKKGGAARRPLFPLKAVPEYTPPATVHYAAVFHEVAHQDIAKQFPGQGSREYSNLILAQLSKFFRPQNPALPGK